MTPAGVTKLFSIELLHRKPDIAGLFGHGIYGIFATPRDEAMRIFAESDVIVLTDPTTDRQYPFPINSKIKGVFRESSGWFWGIIAAAACR
jgi:hypothetical protein